MRIRHKHREALKYFEQAINIIIQVEYVTERDRLHANMLRAKLNVNARTTVYLWVIIEKLKIL